MVVDQHPARPAEFRVVDSVHTQLTVVEYIAVQQPVWCPISIVPITLSAENPDLPHAWTELCKLHTSPHLRR